MHQWLVVDENIPTDSDTDSDLDSDPDLPDLEVVSSDLDYESDSDSDLPQVPTPKEYNELLMMKVRTMASRILFDALSNALSNGADYAIVVKRTDADGGRLLLESEIVHLARKLGWHVEHDNSKMYRQMIQIMSPDSAHRTQ